MQLKYVEVFQYFAIQNSIYRKLSDSQTDGKLNYNFHDDIEVEPLGIKEVSFEDIPILGRFYYHGREYIKFELENKHNALSLYNGWPTLVPYDCPVWTSPNDLGKIIYKGPFA